MFTIRDPNTKYPPITGGGLAIGGRDYYDSEVVCLLKETLDQAQKIIHDHERSCMTMYSNEIGIKRYPKGITKSAHPTSAPPHWCTPQLNLRDIELSGLAIENPAVWNLVVPIQIDQFLGFFHPNTLAPGRKGKENSIPLAWRQIQRIRSNNKARQNAGVESFKSSYFFVSFDDLYISILSSATMGRVIPWPSRCLTLTFFA